MKVDIEDSDVIKHFMQVVFVKGSSTILYYLPVKVVINIFRSKVDVSEAIGKPFWSVFRMESVGKSSYRLVHVPFEEAARMNYMKGSCGVDNRAICDDNSSQLLSRDNIEEMKRSGMHSEDILQAIIQNSTSFSKKTEYSQQKYMKKKSVKHSDYVQILKPNIKTVLASFSKATNSQIIGLRFDTLSFLINVSNFQTGKKCILYESGTQGIIAASLLNSAHPGMKILNVICSQGYQRRAIKALQLDANKRDLLVDVRFELLSKHPLPVCQSVSDDDGAKSEATQVTNASESDAKPERKRSEHDDDYQDSPTKKFKTFSLAEEEVRLLYQEKADSLIIAGKEIPDRLVSILIKFLEPSRPFVVYSPYQNVLAKLYMYMKHNMNVVGVKLVENWCRKYQILENRTHPDVSMNGSNGFILYGMLMEP